MTNYTDQTKPVREGEELDTSRLEDFIKQNVPDVSAPLVIEQFPSGHSNLTYLVRADKNEYVLRRPPFGAEHIKSGHDMSREYRILSKLHRVYPPAPRPLVYCDDTTILGAPFYLMNRIKGIILRKDPPKELPILPDTARKLCENFIDNLAALHAIDYKAAGLEELGKPEGYVRRQVEGWTKRYTDSQTDKIADMETIIAWLAERIPNESGACIIHNDYKYDNIVLDENDITKITGVLDWEMATVGCPLMDLGCTLAYWINHDDPEDKQLMRMYPTNLPGSMTRKELAARYGEKTGLDVSNMLFYYCYALFKVAVIAQQIYFRYAKGFTKDARFAKMLMYVHVLSSVAVQAFKKGTI